MESKLQFLMPRKRLDDPTSHALCKGCIFYLFEQVRGPLRLGRLLPIFNRIVNFSKLHFVIHVKLNQDKKGVKFSNVF